MPVSFIVNGAPAEVTGQDGMSLLEALRDGLGVTGPKFGCGEGACGACTVLVGRRPVTACTTPAAEVAGQRVTTVEGLAEDGLLHPVQQAWLEEGAMQCGYCTPGWLAATAALLARVPHPDDERIAAELAGNVCRCCTYPRIRRAVHRAAELMEHPEELLPVPAAGPATLSMLPQSAADGLPWDQAVTGTAGFFGSLGDGLTAVVCDDETAAAAHDGAWVHVGADGTVTAFTGKVEAGQGTRTALAMLVAEELAIEPSAVRLVMGNTDISPYDMGTFGSRSMPYAAPPLRAAAAGARRRLQQEAAERLGLPASQLTVAGGLVAGPDGAPSTGVAELLAGRQMLEPVPASAPVTPPPAWRAAGRPARALHAAEVVTGGKRFPADLGAAVVSDAVLHGAVLRAPGYGAILRSADMSAARALPGVTVVQDGDFTGVTAADQLTARRAVALVEASWETPSQPSAAELEDYLRAHPAGGDGRFGPFRHEQGDVAAALAAGPLRLDAHYSAAYIAHAPLEPRSALASWEGGRVTIWTGTSTPFRTRSETAAALGVDEADVRVIVPDYGGGFGGKHGGRVAIEAARLARAAGQPVRVQWSRHEEFHLGYLRPAAVIDVSASADRGGRLTGWSHVNINSGAAGIMTPYRVAHQQIAYQPAESPLPQGPYRALASTANHFARESVMDELAARLGADPVEFRLRHLDDERMATVLRTAAARTGWHERGRDGTGTGIACGTEKDGLVATAAQVSVADDGTLRVLRLVTAFDCGAIVNPDNLTNQVEGAVMMGLGPALFEAIDFAGGQILNASLADYRVPRLADLPDVEVVLVDRPDLPSAGGGECPIVAVAPAIGNAIFDACGVRLRSMPMAPSGRVRLSG
ncbi:MAG TPA: molybdopterin cofactor-binding domain-containing protein [Streptosporangiaceae bacterium]